MGTVTVQLVTVSHIATPTDMRSPLGKLTVSAGGVGVVQFRHACPRLPAVDGTARTQLRGPYLANSWSLSLPHYRLLQSVTTAELEGRDFILVLKEYAGYPPHLAVWYRPEQPEILLLLKYTGKKLLFIDFYCLSCVLFTALNGNTIIPNTTALLWSI